MEYIKNSHFQASSLSANNDIQHCLATMIIITEQRYIALRSRQVTTIDIRQKDIHILQLMTKGFAYFNPFSYICLRIVLNPQQSKKRRQRHLAITKYCTFHTLHTKEHFCRQCVCVTHHRQQGGTPDTRKASQQQKLTNGYK